MASASALPIKSKQFSALAPEGLLAHLCLAARHFPHRRYAYRRFFFADFFAVFALTSAFINAINFDTDPIFSRFQIASFNFSCAFFDNTPSANAANFSSTSASLNGFRGSPLG